MYGGERLIWKALCDLLQAAQPYFNFCLNVYTRVCVCVYIIQFIILHHDERYSTTTIENMVEYFSLRPQQNDIPAYSEASETTTKKNVISGIGLMIHNRVTRQRPERQI